MSVAVIGCGGFGQFHIREWEKIVGMQRLCVVDKSEALALQCEKNAIEKFHLVGDFKGVYGGIEALLERESAVKFASVATPHESHVRVSATLIGAGVNVLVEKPAVPIPFELDELGHLPTSAIEVPRPALRNTFQLTATCDGRNGMRWSCWQRKKESASPSRRSMQPPCGMCCDASLAPTI